MLESIFTLGNCTHCRLHNYIQLVIWGQLEVNNHFQAQSFGEHSWQEYENRIQLFLVHYMLIIVSYFVNVPNSEHVLLYIDVTTVTQMLLTSLVPSSYIFGDLEGCNDPIFIFASYQCEEGARDVNNIWDTVVRYVGSFE